MSGPGPHDDADDDGEVRLAVFGQGSIPGIKIAWDADVELAAEVTAALAAHAVRGAQVGVLQRGYAVGGETYPRGSLAFRVGVGHEVFLQRPAAAPRPARATPPPPPPPMDTTASVTLDGAGAHHQVRVGGEHDGERADRVIVAMVPTLSRSQVQRLIDGGHVAVAGQPVRKANQRLRAGDVLTIEPATT